jgi:hypothetical protein
MVSMSVLDPLYEGILAQSINALEQELVRNTHGRRRTQK